jgi:hypothetical protein
MWEKELMSAASNDKLKQTRKSAATHLEVEDHPLDLPNGWDDMHAFIPEGSPEPAAGVEEGDDEDSVRVRESPDTKHRRFVEGFPRPVGVPIGQGKTKFQEQYERHLHEGQSIYSPFANEEEWDLAQWLSRHVGQKATDEYLKLPIVSGYL